MFFSFSFLSDGQHVFVWLKGNNSEKGSIFLVNLKAFSHYSKQAEGQKPRQRVSVANRKIFARPENICVYCI